MMRARDSAFMVDHRRQLSLPPPGVAGAAAAKKDEVAKKKKAGQHLQHQRAQQKAAQPPPESSASGKAPGPMSVKKSAKESAKEDVGTSAPAPSSKKTPSKQQLKRERKEKAAKAAAAAAAEGKSPASQSSSTTSKKAVSSSPAVSTATPTKAAQVSSQASERPDGEMEQDGLKSRNHKMVLAPSRSLSAMHFPSWRTRQQSAFATHSVADRLHDEILEYTNYTKATVERMRVHIEEMIVNVRECVHSLWPQSKVETFGSYSTGIWLPSSDVDLVVLDVVEVIDSKKTVKHLRELAKVLESKSWVESIVVLETAKIPVLKLVSAESSVPIDVTFESAATHSGLLARDLIKRYAEEIPELYPLAILFKQLLRERGLNDAYTGGLSSYSVVLMLIHFSQLRRNGQLCFEAAAVYASGSLPPLPSSFAQLEKAAKSQDKADVSQSTAAQEYQPKSVKQGDLVGEPPSIDKSKKPATVAPPAVSYAALLVRPTATSGQSSAGKESSAPSQEKRSPAPSKPRFSYADVAAGVVKVTAPAPPPSYAAALTAKPGTYDMSAKMVAPSSSSSARAPADVGSKESKRSEKSAKASSSNNNTPSDAVSVSSSSADTEESTSSVASTASSAADSDDEASKSRDQIHEHDQDEVVLVPVSLGEHTLMILEFFGILFDYRKNGLSIRDGGYIYRLAENRRSEIGKPALVIEDPIHPDRNVSASSFAFSKVVAVFEDSFYALKYYRPSKFVPTALSCLLSCSGHTIDLPSKKID